MKDQKAYVPFELKAVDEQARTFSGLAATWDLDLDGDVIQKGAFAHTLNRWRDHNGRQVLPLIDQHNYGSVRNVFGKLLEAAETDTGLDCVFEIVSTPDGDEYLGRIKGGFLNGLSIGFTVTKRGEEERDGKLVRIIKEVTLHEISAVIWGANPNALMDTAAAKALIRSFAGRELEPAERKDLETLQAEIAALLKAPEAEGIAPGSGTAEKMEAWLQRLASGRGIAV